MVIAREKISAETGKEFTASTFDPLVNELAKKVTSDPEEQRAFYEMFVLGFNQYPFTDANSSQMKACMESKLEQMTGFYANYRETAFNNLRKKGFNIK